MARLTSQRAATPHEGARWILASASPRRRELLASAGQAFDVVPSGADESPLPGESGAERSRRLAVEKATEVATRVLGRWVLGADTLVLSGDHILGKPANATEARAMLAELSGRDHHVVTGFALVSPDGMLVEATVVDTRVRFRKLSEGEIDAYLQSNEWQDKAGGYAIQGAAGAFVGELCGSYSNVVGLPMEAVERALRARGIWHETRS